ncbi:MAG: hypothetical protein R3B07_09720 [Polyangiaceae bacterium]
MPGKVAGASLASSPTTARFPFDPRKPFDPSGLRIGTPSITRARHGHRRMKKLADWMRPRRRCSEDGTCHREHRRRSEGTLRRLLPTPGIPVN